MPATASPEIKGFFDEPTNTVSYLVWDPATMEGAAIDPVLDFDHRSGEAKVESADAMLTEAKARGMGFVVSQGVRGRLLWTDWLQRNYRRTLSAA